MPGNLYRERPPATARTARLAWDYFQRKWPGRPIRELGYSPKCDGIRQWVCEYEVRDSDMEHWGVCYGGGVWTKTATPYEIKRWAGA